MSGSSDTSPNTPSIRPGPSAWTKEIGSLEKGKLADIILWNPAFFGIKPELVVKGGFIVWGAMGDSAASLMTCEPIMMRPQWGAFGVAKEALSVNFISGVAAEKNIGESWAFEKGSMPSEYHAASDQEEYAS
jgi:urease subunit alpha